MRKQSLLLGGISCPAPTPGTVYCLSGPPLALRLDADGFAEPWLVRAALVQFNASLAQCRSLDLKSDKIIKPFVVVAPQKKSF